MRAPIRSHGFNKPSDLEDELSELEDDVKPTIRKTAARTKTTEKPAVDASLRKDVEELRKQLDAIRKQVEKLKVAQANLGNTHTVKTSARRNQDSRQSVDIASWLPIVRSVAITSLSGRIFASSPIMAVLVAAVPFLLGLSAGSKS